MLTLSSKNNTVGKMGKSLGSGFILSSLEESDITRVNAGSSCGDDFVRFDYLLVILFGINNEAFTLFKDSIFVNNTNQAGTFFEQNIASIFEIIQGLCL